MDVFIMHIGYPGLVDVKYTVSRRRSIQELLTGLPPNAPELDYFQNDHTLHTAFPNGQFNCWGVPGRAKPSFVQTQIGDLVLIVPQIGLHGGGVEYIGIVKSKCPLECYEASRILWPDTPNERLYPWLFFFDTEAGYRGWYEFLEDLGIQETWNPRGWYKRLASHRFDKWGGPEGYLQLLRTRYHFGAL
jgi:hypothetical protein